MRYCSVFLYAAILVNYACPSIAADADCKALKKIHQRYWKNSEDPSVKGLVADWKATKQGDSFKGLDIDKDGKADRVIRNCGNGRNAICQLKIYFSRGGEITADDKSPFYIMNNEGLVYMVETVEPRVWTFSRKHELILYELKYKEITKACHWMTIIN